MTDGAWTIRRAIPRDASAVAELAARTFIETFAANNDPEDMAAYVAAAFGMEQQERELRNPDDVTLVAETEGELVAYAQIARGPHPACVTGPRPVELRRFYVARPWQGQGLAARLMDATVDAARALGGETLWLGVWEKNPRAIAFYVRAGFRDVGEQAFQLGADMQTDRVMSRPIEPGAPAQGG